MTVTRIMQYDADMVAERVLDRATESEEAPQSAAEMRRTELPSWTAEYGSQRFGTPSGGT